MRHRIAGRKLGRTSEHRLALMRNLSSALFDKEKITTTLAKAKELRPFAEKLVTLSKRETLHARRLVLRHVQDKKVVAKLFDTLSARYAQRPGGYTRIIRLAKRRIGDNGDLAILQLVGEEEPGEKVKVKVRGRRRKTLDRIAALEGKGGKRKGRGRRSKAGKPADEAAAAAEPAALEPEAEGTADQTEVAEEPAADESPETPAAEDQQPEDKES